MRILCIGDSNTWGYDAQTKMRFEKRWTRLLAEMRPQDEILEEGMNGRTFAFRDPFCPERCGMDALPVLLRTHDPIDLVIVMLGTNDLKVFFHAQAKAIAKGARNFIETIQNPTYYHYDVPKILIISPVWIGDGIEESEGDWGDFDHNSWQQSRYLAQEIEKVCETYHVDFMDASQYALPSSYDHIHLDQENHAKLARAIQAKLDSM